MPKAKRSLPEFGKQTLIMGILNLTPDSFSGDGLMETADPLEASLIQAQQFIQGGAHILDIGGESTRPGAHAVEAEEEQTRIIPIIQALNHAYPGTLLSVDTYKAQVAEAALIAGADWVNDVWGLRADPELVQVVSRHKAPVILMHNRMTPNSVSVKDRLGSHYVGVQYSDLISDVKTELLESVNIALTAGVSESNIILDPGIGFGKTVEQNLKLLNHLNEICALGFPVLLGVSRKSFIGLTLDLPPNERLEGSLAANAIGILRGASILRVHDVKQTARLAKMVDAIMHAN